MSLEHHDALTNEQTCIVNLHSLLFKHSFSLTRFLRTCKTHYRSFVIRYLKQVSEFAAHFISVNLLIGVDTPMDRLSVVKRLGLGKLSYHVLFGQAKRPSYNVDALTMPLSECFDHILHFCLQIEHFLQFKYELLRHITRMDRYECFQLLS